MSETERRKKAQRRHARGFSLREDIPGRAWSASTSRLADVLRYEENVDEWVAKNTKKREP